MSHILYIGIYKVNTMLNILYLWMNDNIITIGFYDVIIKCYYYSI